MSTATVQLPSGEVILDIKANGNGMAIGKTAETDNLFDIGSSARVRGNLTIDGTLSLPRTTAPVTDGANATTAVTLEKTGPVVHLSGYMWTTSTVANVETLFTIPPGYIPNAVIRTVAASNDDVTFRWFRFDNHTGAVTNDGTAIASGKYFVVDVTYFVN